MPFFVRLAIRLTLIISAAFLITGCVGGSTARPSLDSAEAVMEEYPDSALSILCGIDYTSIHGNDEKAKYALLMTQAMVKNGFLLYSDSLLLPAIEYYSTDEESPELMKTLFYQSEIEMNRFDSIYNEYQQNTGYSPYDYLAKSTVLATQAYDMSVKYNDNLWRAKSAEMLADAYSRSMQYKKSLEYTEDAAIYYKRANKIRNHRYSLCDVGYRYFINSDTTKSISILDSISEIASQNPVDSGLLRYCYRRLYKVYVEANQFNNASGIRIEIDSMRYPVDKTILISDAEIALKQNNINKAIEYAKIFQASASSIIDKMQAYRIFAISNSMLGDHEKASSYLDTIIMLQYHDYSNAIEESASSAQRDYFNRLVSEKQNQLNKSKYLIYSLAIIAILTITAHILYFRHQIKKRKTEMDKTIAKLLLKTDELKQLDRTIKNLTEINEQLKDEGVRINANLHTQKEQLINIDKENEGLRKTLSSMWSSINMLCRQYFSNGEKNKDSKEIVSKIEKKISELNSSKNIEEIEKVANQLHKGIIRLLKESCPGLSPDDIKFATLIYAGFDTATICMILGIDKTKIFHNRKYRLREKIISYGVAKEDPLITLLF